MIVLLFKIYLQLESNSFCLMGPVFAEVKSARKPWRSYLEKQE